MGGKIKTALHVAKCIMSTAENHTAKRGEQCCTALGLRRTRNRIGNDERIIMKNRKHIYLLNHTYYNGKEEKTTTGIQANSRTKPKKNFRNFKTKH